MMEIEAWNARVGFLLAEANSWLDQLTYTFKPEKNPEMTELDRRVKLDDAVSTIREARDKVESLRESIKQRLILGESILAYERMFIEKGIKEPEKIW